MNDKFLASSQYESAIFALANSFLKSLKESIFNTRTVFTLHKTFYLLFCHYIILFCHNEKVLIGGPLIIMEKESIKNEVQLFKSGNSWSFRVTSKDRKELNATKDTMFEKIVDPDKKEIIF
jgi:hypothetical protein